MSHVLDATECQQTTLPLPGYLDTGFGQGTESLIQVMESLAKPSYGLKRPEVICVWDLFLGCFVISLLLLGEKMHNTHVIELLLNNALQYFIV